LPLDHFEPFAATLGIMLYPELDEAGQRKARAATTKWLAEPLRRFYKDGHTVSNDKLFRIAVGAGESLNDLDDRCWGGTASGELVKAMWALFNTECSLASWNNAIRIAEQVAAREQKPGSRSKQWAARKTFLSVAHLWGAWSLRKGEFKQHPEVGYDGWTDFQFFLAEAEILRDWLQTWRPSRKKAEPLILKSLDMWRVPDGWRPPESQSGWPQTGRIPRPTLPEELLASLRPAGRPHKIR
jgi:hypothetical protein